MLIDIHPNDMDRPTEMGGYFGLELPDYGDAFPHASKFQSGRAALRAVIECSGIRRVMLPAFVCDSVIQSVIDSGAIVETYLLDDSLYPKDLPDTLPDEYAFLYVNYFGLCQENIDRLLRAIPSKQVIIDNCQALFASSPNALATIYSVRKFVGVPDGGLVVAHGLKIANPEQEDMASTGRMRHLILRMAYSARDGYPDFDQSERTLSNTKPLRMSRLTKRLLAATNMTAVKRQRRENFLALAERLERHNAHKWNLGPDTVPLCYPLIVDWDVDQLRKKLIGKGIYIPTYWNDAISRIAPNSIEFRLTHSCLAVPCDQRYLSSQMFHLADVIVSGFDGKK